jgi:HAD superfamily hydrolase (TIGR01549 family)
MLKVVTFDFWDTPFGNDDSPQQEQRRVKLIADELAALGTPRSETAVGAALRAAYGWFERIWRGEQRTPSAAETLAVVFATLAVSPPGATQRRVTDAFEQLVLDPPPALVPGVSSSLPQLAAKYKLGIICDTGYAPGRVLRQLLAQQGLLQYFSSVYFSNEGGRSKPDRRVFGRVLAELGVRPDEAAHVGDSMRTDIAGAHQAGMLAIHFIGVDGGGLGGDSPSGFAAGSRSDAVAGPDGSGSASSDGIRAASSDGSGSTGFSGDAVITRFTDLPAALANLACTMAPPR